MKSPAAYYLLLLYLTVVLKPVLPVVSDMCSHTFNEFEHIANVHAKYGSEHLQKELAENEASSNKTQHTMKLQNDATEHVCVKHVALCCAFTLTDKQPCILPEQKLLPAHVAKHSPPPKIS